jgi:hypothetical protein
MIPRVEYKDTKTPHPLAIALFWALLSAALFIGVMLLALYIFLWWKFANGLFAASDDVYMYGFAILTMSFVAYITTRQKSR